MQTQTLIIGGGLTGLALAYRLDQAGHDYRLVEAQSRLGGRIKSLDVAGAAFDLGPSWIWDGQSRVEQLLSDLGLGRFPQYSDGAQLFEQADGDVLQNQGFMSMEGSFRISGGTSALIDALTAALDPSRINLGQTVTRITQDPCGAWLDHHFIAADNVVLAIPPRIAATLAFDPALPDPAMAALRPIPTWMAAHAKCVAVYETPFWRKAGLSGDASSRRGPMVEIHDASADAHPTGALFGFIGVPADMRATAGDALKDACLAQLVNLFGPMAATPLALTIKDWSQAKFTATPQDATPPQGHPAYIIPRQLRNLWQDKLIVAAAELADDNGGLIEGALSAAERVARQIMGV